MRPRDVTASTTPAEALPDPAKERQQRHRQDAERHHVPRRVTGQVRATSTSQPRRGGSEGSAGGLEEKGPFTRAQSLDGTQQGASSCQRLSPNTNGMPPIASR